MGTRQVTLSISSLGSHLQSQSCKSMYPNARGLSALKGRQPDAFGENSGRSVHCLGLCCLLISSKCGISPQNSSYASLSIQSLLPSLAFSFLHSVTSHHSLNLSLKQTEFFSLLEHIFWYQGYYTIMKLGEHAIWRWVE